MGRRIQALLSLDEIITNLERSIEIESGYASEKDASNALLEYLDVFTGISSVPVDTSFNLEYKDAVEKPVLDGNTLFGMCVAHYDADGDYYVDGYGDTTIYGSWQDCIARLEQQKKQTGKKYLIPHLDSHKKESVIGGVVKLQETPKGVYYESTLANTRRAQEIKALCKDGMLGASYGYTADVTQQVYHAKSQKMVRRLSRVTVHEISAVAFPAVPYTTASIKSALTSYMRTQGYDTSNIKRLCNRIDDALTQLELQAIRSR